MNKKYAVYGLLMMFLMTNVSIFSMHQLIFRGAKMIGRGTLPVVGGAFAYTRNEEYKKTHRDLKKGFHNNIMELLPETERHLFYHEKKNSVMPVRVEKWIRGRMEKLNIYEAQTMPMEVGNFDGSWGVVMDAILLGSKSEVEKLNIALQVEADNVEARDIIDEKAMRIGHEIWHYINKDGKKKFYSLFLTPLMIEALSSTVTRTFNKIYNIEVPKTWLKTTLRSSAAIGSIVPKIYLNLFGLVCYQRYQEANADRFSCENAETRNELEVCRNCLQKYADDFEKTIVFPEGTNEFKKKIMVRLLACKRDPIHPYIGDRAAMVQEYIYRWDADHAGTCDAQQSEYK